MVSKLLVNIGEAKVLEKDGILVAYSLSSCVALMFYDKKRKIAGMSHVILPKSDSHISYEEYPKFGDKAAIYLLEEMKKYGTNKHDIVAKIVGGSDIFQSGMICIGKKNVESVKKTLKNLGIRIVGEDVGGRILRTVFFHANTGKAIVKTNLYTLEI